MIDSYTKLIALAPIKTHTTEELMSVLFRSWICRYGCPENLTSDNEGGFCGDLASKFYALLGCKKSKSVSHRSEGNALGESAVRLSKHVLTTLLLEYDRSGGQDRSLGYVEYCLNSTPSTSHGLSPWMVLTGSEMRVPSSLFTEIKNEATEIPIGVRALRRKCMEISRHVFTRTGQQMASQTDRYNVRAVSKEEIKEGNRVLYLAYNLSNDKRALAAAYKDEENTVLRKVGSNYLIKLASDPTTRSARTVHYNQVRPVLSSNFHSADNSSRIAAKNARQRIDMLLASKLTNQIS